MLSLQYHLVWYSTLLSIVNLVTGNLQNYRTKLQIKQLVALHAILRHLQDGGLETNRQKKTCFYLHTYTIVCWLQLVCMVEEKY